MRDSYFSEEITTFGTSEETKEEETESHRDGVTSPGEGRKYLTPIRRRKTSGQRGDPRERRRRSRIDQLMEKRELVEK